MKYYFEKTVDGTFDEAIVKVSDLLKTESFGVLTRIDMDEKLKEKLGVDIKRYAILGACNPAFAYKVMLEEPRIGLMLPCNVIVRELENGKVEVAVINPLASMQSVENVSLGDIAGEVTEKLKRVVAKL